ncbi:MAG: FG-GAP repeat protein [Trueperaceae bacterium]
MNQLRVYALAICVGLVMLVAACSGAPAEAGPSITQLSARSTNANQTVSVAFTVSDADVGSLVLSVSSSNQAVVADAGLSITGSGTDRVLVIAPVPDAVGTTTISVSATNALGRSAATSFVLTVSQPGITAGPMVTAPDAALAAAFGGAVAVGGDYLVVGAARDGQTETALGHGAAYVYHQAEGAWVYQAKLLPSDSWDNQWFGNAVAIHGDYVIVGAEHDNELGAGAGAAYVFRRDGATWTEQAKLLPWDTTAGSNFGLDVAIHGDYAAVSSYAGSSTGSVYIFQRNGEAWTQHAKLRAPTPTEWGNFGTSMAMTQDTIYVGSFAEAVYVFGRNGDEWTELAQLTAADGEDGDYFGMGVAATDDLVVVGATAHDVDGQRSGAAYVFTREGNEWTAGAKLTPSQPTTLTGYGEAIAISQGRMVIGSRGDPGAAPNAGAAYVYQLSGGEWSEVAVLRAADAAENDWFGVAVALGADEVFVGASGKDGVELNSGAVYSFNW